MRRPNGQPRFAYVTFLMLNDNYLPGALVLGFGLRKQSTSAALVCLVTDGVSEQALHSLSLVFDHLIKVTRFYVPHARRQERQDRPFFFTRIHALRLGSDGDLGVQFEKIVVLDADVLPLKNCDHLFSLNTPAGVLNESKSHVIESDVSGKYEVTNEILKSGKWAWHRHYEPICPHGASVPTSITDRVADDPTNMGMNGSLFVLEPSRQNFEEICRDIQRPEIKKLVGDSFDWPDMQYLTMHWSGKWTNIDARFSGLNGYPHVSVLFSTHFAGFKPWYFNRAKTMARYARHADFRLWFEMYLELVEKHPTLLEMGKLRNVKENTENYLTVA